MEGVVSIGCFHEHLAEGGRDAVTVAIDVIRATTTAVTVVAGGRRCLVAASIEDAVALAGDLEDPLLAGELGGWQPYGFDLQNSPAEVSRQEHGGRPVILLSTSGTRLMREAAAAGTAYAACLRNARAQATDLIDRHERVRLLGADSRGEFREEDQLCCAWIARSLVEAGWTEADAETQRVLERWGRESPDAFLGGRSSTYLRDTGQSDDLDFVLNHVDDLDSVFPLAGPEVTMRALG